MDVGLLGPVARPIKYACADNFHADVGEPAHVLGQRTDAHAPNRIVAQQDVKMRQRFAALAFAEAGLLADATADSDSAQVFISHDLFAFLGNRTITRSGPLAMRSKSPAAAPRISDRQISSHRGRLYSGKRA